jgi:hypothetical protein
VRKPAVGRSAPGGKFGKAKERDTVRPDSFLSRRRRRRRRRRRTSLTC